MNVVTPRGDVLTQFDGQVIDSREGEILQFSCVRNESLRLPYFLSYHRQLGVDRFVIVDNASDDGTLEYLLTQPDVHVFHTTARYSESSYGVEWINALADRFAVDRWILVVDADELLVYPDCENVGLVDLTGQLDAAGSTAMSTFLLDMYDDRPIGETVYEPGTPFIDRCPFFDAGGYEFTRLSLRRRVPVRGGARRRLFWADPDTAVGNPPVLTKYPLIRWGPGVVFEASTHRVRQIRPGSTTGALLHFKMFSDFAETIRVEVERSEHWDGAAQYQAYSSIVTAHPDLNPADARSVRYRDSSQLVEAGLMNRAGWFSLRRGRRNHRRTGGLPDHS